jgi:hypothetical protein
MFLRSKSQTAGADRTHRFSCPRWPFVAWYRGSVHEGGSNRCAYAEPCGDELPPKIPVGSTVEDFTNALVDHPKT